MLFHSSYTALLTPFKDNKVDYSSYRELIDFQINNGTHGLVPVGTTGESPTLSHDEHKQLIEVCIEQSNGRVPVIAGAGSNSTSEAVDFVKHACSAGADGLLVEVHACPEEALCDGAQSLLPGKFKKMVDRLEPLLEVMNKSLYC